MLLRRLPLLGRPLCIHRTIMTTPASADFEGEIISEGRAKILFPKGNQVFYNKVQVLNRDLSIAVINQFAHERAKETILKQRKREKNDAVPTIDEVQAHVRDNADTNGLKIFEALAASGLRSIRYLQEIEGVQSILVNDLDPAAVISIKRNIEYNQLSTDKLIPNEDDATSVMYSHRKEADNFDVIDLDPYGSASIFLDGAVQAIANGGLLCVTCTDMPVLCGKDPDLVVRLVDYDILLVLHSIESAAVKYQKHIVPIISCSIDFYVRVFVRVYKSPVNVKASMTKQSYVYQEPDVVGSGKCDQCGRRFKMSGTTVPNDVAYSKETIGPIWSAPLHNKDLVLKIRDNVLKNPTKYPTKDRLHGLLTSVSEEVQEDAPLYYTLPGLSKTLHCQQPRMDQVQVALINAGYNVSQSHKVPEAVKTNAPNHVVWDIMRSWRVNDNHDVGVNILAKEPAFEAQFSGKRPSADKEKALRFPKNPEAHWGPKSRARGLAPSELANVVGRCSLPPISTSGPSAFPKPYSTALLNAADVRSPLLKRTSPQTYGSVPSSPVIPSTAVAKNKVWNDKKGEKSAWDYIHMDVRRQSRDRLSRFLDQSDVGSIVDIVEAVSAVAFACIYVTYTYLPDDAHLVYLWHAELLLASFFLMDFAFRGIALSTEPLDDMLSFTGFVNLGTIFPVLPVSFFMAN
ncbi:hypothetical protein DYB30_008475 [Aphanomyces astaci]|uniref:tRNA (guanine(26)-N(2))-dimethyltransferase n=1 Tax=Aphanomyces astaci TaxID=112090 RepID=A0A397C6U7_APHAT|nr:hypothetical protein DYB30_008475 [Aphanomyces astaci]